MNSWPCILTEVLKLQRPRIVKLCTVLQKYLELAQDLELNENVLLQTLGFDLAIDHPHTHVVRCCHLVRGKCLAVVTRRGGKCRQQVYILGLPKLNETVVITDIYGIELHVGMCFCVPHCHQNVLPPVLSGIYTYHTCLFVLFSNLLWCVSSMEVTTTIFGHFCFLLSSIFTLVQLSCHRFSSVTVSTNVVSVSLLPSFVSFLWFLMDCVHCMCLVLWYVNIRWPFVMYRLFSLLLSWAPPLMSGGVPVDAGFLCNMIAVLGVVIEDPA